MTSSYKPPVKKAASAPTQRRKKSVSLERKKAWAGWIFVLPFVLGFVIIYAPLIVESIYTSLSIEKGFDDNLRVIREFVAFDNYKKAFLENPNFTKVLVTGLTELLFDIPAIVIFSLFMAVLLNQKMTPQMLSTEENKQKLEMLLRAFFNRLHGYHVQYNIVSRETLLDAQAHPEKHKDLIVRVAGYSAFFNVLSRKTQDDIIGRTEQSL